MNIFVLDKNPVVAAQSLCDRHVNKMILESAQMLSSVAARWQHPALYKIAYAKHPCTLWAGDSYDNWLWLIKHSLALEQEKIYRTGKGHKSAEVIRWYQKNNCHPPINNSQMTPFAQAMPNIYKDSNNPVQAYRKYYLNDKQYFKDGRRPRWTKRNPPDWWKYL